ncbi:MAG: hypothetical protein C5B55_07660 [Blastocatellia bacterium]|nr:MAG: hypothetical protein C5B55_07660 [Blastocatellia bacterium]
MHDEFYVVGSGPTGVAAAKALLDAGLSVTMLDAGVSLEASRQELLDETLRAPAQNWNDKSLALFKAGTNATSEGIPLKLAYGSDFPYRNADQFVSSTSQVGIVPSLARGGFSNVWGAAVLPYRANDTGDWPFAIEELTPHYRAMLNLTGLAGSEDGLSKDFPLFIEPHQNLSTGSLVASLLSDMERFQNELTDRGIRFGKSRLAVSKTNPNGFACASCNMCMYGCPYGLIYNSSDSLKAMTANPAFSYHPNVIVKTFHETAGGVEIRAYNCQNRKDVTFHASRLFVAAGTLSTTRLVLESIGKNEPATLKDSQYFLLPLLRFSAPSHFRLNESAHTLAQAFIEILDTTCSEKSIHLQVYGYNELYPRAIREKLGAFLANLSQPAIKEFLKRFLLLQGYLHSDYSHKIEARLLPRTETSLTGKLALTVKQNPLTSITMDRLVKKLKSLKGLLRGFTLSPLLKMGSVGRGFHTGGSFPMSLAPQDNQTDILGRPYGYDRVHLVDSSVFPSIPANTITLTAMANAHRIAATAAAL